MDDEKVLINIKDYEKDEHILVLIGGAVLRIWRKLPKNLKEEILTKAENLVLPKPPPTKVRKRFKSVVIFNNG